jgi:hypothetical protein
VSEGLDAELASQPFQRLLEFIAPLVTALKRNRGFAPPPNMLIAGGALGVLIFRAIFCFFEPTFPSEYNRKL